MRKLSQYKFTDDIFNSVLTIKEGKNHGLVILLDWSLSMETIAKNIIIQTRMLTEFCREVKIPYEVYLFTDTSFVNNLREYNIDHGFLPLSDCRRDDSSRYCFSSRGMGDNFVLLRIADDRMKVDDEIVVLTALYNHTTISMSRFTPSVLSMIVLSDVVNKFRKRYRLQVINTCVICDGNDNCTNTASGGDLIQDRTYGYSFSRFKLLRKVEGIEKAINRNLCVAFYIFKKRTGSRINYIFLEGSYSNKSYELRRHLRNSNIDGKELERASSSLKNSGYYSFTDLSFVDSYIGVLVEIESDFCVSDKVCGIINKDLSGATVHAAKKAFIGAARERTRNISIAKEIAGFMA